MKLTNKQLRQIIKEELEYVLEEQQMYRGQIEINQGDRESTSYSIEGASGSFGGRQSLNISAINFYNSGADMAEAENTARQWVNFLNRKHGLNLDQQSFADSLKRGSIRVNVRNVSSNRDAGGAGFSSSMGSFYGE